MRDQFTTDLAHLERNLQRMTRHVRHAAGHLRTLLAGPRPDPALAQRILDADDRLDNLADQVKYEAMQLLALQSPVAGDLRLVSATLTLANTIERQGDLVRNIAALVGRGSGFPVPLTETLVAMAELVQLAAERDDQVVAEPTQELIQVIEDADDDLDDLHARLLKQIADPAVTLERQQVIDLALIGRFLERFGDHSTSLAQQIDFISTGKAVRHGAGTPRDEAEVVARANA